MRWALNPSSSIGAMTSWNARHELREPAITWVAHFGPCRAAEPAITPVVHFGPSGGTEPAITSAVHFGAAAA